MLCHPTGQIKPYASTRMNVTGLTEITEFISMQSAHPCDRKPKSYLCFCYSLSLKESGHLLWRKTLHSCCSLLLDLLKEGDPPIFEE